MFDIIRHGSENSLDEDIFVIVYKQYTNQDAKELCESFLPKNANLIMIKNGIVSWCYKGTVDECNNAILATFNLHKQYLSECPIKYRVIRNKQEKILRTIRGILSYCSRTQYRIIVKQALKSNDIKLKIDTLKQIDLYSIHDFKKNTKIEVYKFLAFQLGQTLALVEKDLELYTKNNVIQLYPNLKPYLMRVDTNNITILNEYLHKFINYLEQYYDN